MKMSDYPNVYGYCDAGCKRRVPSYEEMADMGALKAADLGDGNTSVDVMLFDYFVLINEGDSFADTYILGNVDKDFTANELYAHGYFVKMKTSWAYAIGVHFSKADDGNFTAEVKYRIGDGEWENMNFSKIYGLRRLPGDIMTDYLNEIDTLVGGDE